MHINTMTAGRWNAKWVGALILFVIGAAAWAQQPTTCNQSLFFCPLQRVSSATASIPLVPAASLPGKFILLAFILVAITLKEDRETSVPKSNRPILQSSHLPPPKSWRDLSLLQTLSLPPPQNI
jgi:hypothetical protein